MLTDGIAVGDVVGNKLLVVVGPLVGSVLGACEGSFDGVPVGIALGAYSALWMDVHISRVWRPPFSL